ncbi:inositol monophosphatase family protein [Rubellicoccus peritrichatus]|uniref:Inositol monophosphatase family protein n=1 Tax=Rubellicoccus peritrichatus TaxID=3080537 RepID=A0AAQ3LAX9_9BACT|nr:inositol monophosphatase family protein [Puniceicoccus sp. CR14]WOO42779.1 inositol monophosphatase family protein [Puniceicoccus sp. CR14]
MQKLKDFVEEVMLGSGEIIRRYWDDDTLVTKRKADDSPVTAADCEAELYIREMITKRFPDHGVIGEEFPDAAKDAEFVWIIDPIDGTKSFISHVPLFGTLLGLLHRGQPILGAINQPIIRELLIGDNESATLNGVRTSVRHVETFDEATFLTTDPELLLREDQYPGIRELYDSCRLKRTWGDCYGYFLLATGRADIMIDPVLAPWDLLPLIPVVRGAGGIITDLKGDDPVDGDSAVATSPGLHRKVIEVLGR